MEARLRRILRVAAVGAAVLCAVGAGGAGATTINFDGYADHTNLNGVDLGGVTVTNPSGVVEVFANRFGVSSHSGTNAIGSFTGPQSINPMTFVFSTAVSFVELFAGDAGGPGGDPDQWTMNVYNATVGGTLLASLTSAVWNGSPYQGLSFSGSNIWRIEAVWTAPGCCGIGFDDLTFTPGAGGGGGGDGGGGVPPVPLPAGGLMLLSALGAGGFAARRRRA